MFLLFLVVCGVIALVVVKVVKPNKAAIQSATAAITPPAVSDWVNNTNAQIQNALGQRHRALLVNKQAAMLIAGPDPHIGAPQPQQQQYQQEGTSMQHQHSSHHQVNQDRSGGSKDDASADGAYQQSQTASGWLQLLSARYCCPRKLVQFCAAAAVRLGAPMPPTV